MLVRASKRRAAGGFSTSDSPQSSLKSEIHDHWNDYFYLLLRLFLPFLRLFLPFDLFDLLLRLKLPDVL